MRNGCDSDEWVPDSQEVEHLSPFGSEQHSIVTIGYVDNIEPYQIGKAAGFSGGRLTKRSAGLIGQARRQRRQNTEKKSCHTLPP